MEEELRSAGDFKRLQAWQAARELRKFAYKISQRLPDYEKFGLANQMRRAAVSVTNNIAEGHGRFHYMDQVKFLLQSRGSLEELVDDFTVCEDENYIPAADLKTAAELANRAAQLLNGYARYLRRQKKERDGEPS